MSSYIEQLERDNEELRALLATKQFEEDKLESLQKYERLFLFIKNHTTNLDTTTYYDSLNQTKINIVLDVYDHEDKELLKEFYANLFGRFLE